MCTLYMLITWDAKGKHQEFVENYDDTDILTLTLTNKKTYILIWLPFLRFRIQWKPNAIKLNSCFVCNVNK